MQDGTTFVYVPLDHSLVSSGRERVQNPLVRTQMRRESVGLRASNSDASDEDDQDGIAVTAALESPTLERLLLPLASPQLDARAGAGPVTWLTTADGWQVPV